VLDRLKRILSGIAGKSRAIKEGYNGAAVVQGALAWQMNHDTGWMTIVPGQGLGSIRFGMTEREVESILGEAPVPEFERDGELSYVRMEYPGKDLNIYFSQENEFRLDSLIAFENPICELFGEPLFPRRKDKLLDLLQRNLAQENVKVI